MILLAILAAQATDVSEITRQFNTVDASAKQVMDQAFQCMDSHIKSEIKAHISDASPAVIVDASLSSYLYLKKAYADAIALPGGLIEPAKAQELAESWFGELPKVYLNHVDESLSRPDISNVRFDYALAKWRICIDEKAKNWSRLSDEASTVGRAAVTSCSDYRINVQSTIAYVVRSKKLPESATTEALRRFDSQMADIATEVVISERAKRLPKR